jgi:hypothetical protein
MRFVAGALLILLQVAAALPWLAALDPKMVRGWFGRHLLPFLGVLAALAAAGVAALFVVRDRDTLEMGGRIYGALLYAQLTADVLVGVFAVLLLAWPKGGAVALAAFREGVRQPMFWLIAGLALLLLGLSPFIPYFTFGEDYKMVQELGYDTIMLATILFGVLAASISISEEIEGRTAITLMSKPLSRRQFLLGKYVGIFLAAVVMTALLGWFFIWVLLYKHWYERMDPVPTPAALAAVVEAFAGSAEAQNFVRGAAWWFRDVFDVLPGLILGSCKVMVLLAVAVCLATRLPMVANLVTCLVIYLLGHLTPVLIAIGQQSLRLDPGGGSAVGNMLYFMAQVFEAILPGFDLFGVGSMLASDPPPPALAFNVYVLEAVGYGVLYTVIVLLAGLFLFEDRDLA